MATNSYPLFKDTWENEEKKTDTENTQLIRI